MIRSTTLGLAAAALIGAAVLPAAAASAAPRLDGAAPLVLIASGGWATRAEGKRSTYDDPYYGGYGYGYGYGYRDGYGAPAYGYAPYGGGGYDDEDGYDAY